jgi:hypothetical protein
MGWAYGIVNGRKVGYSVAAKCDKRGCKTKIDRGLAYCCGDMHGGDDKHCGGYFCYEHLTYADGVQGQICVDCASKLTVNKEVK